jgi:LPS-assembly lipoprotein
MLNRRGILGLAAASLLPGCGFQPVYMPTASGKAGVAQRELAAISVGVIGERAGQLLRQALQERFEASGTTASRAYELTISYGVSGEAIGIQPDTSVTRIRLIGEANWSLMAIDPLHSRLTHGRAKAVDDFDVINQQFFAMDLSNGVAQQRLADALADQITIQLSAWFRQRAAATSG